MLNQKIVIKRLPTSMLFPIKFHQNVREETGQTYNVGPLKDEILQSGRVDRITVAMNATDISDSKTWVFNQIVRGFRRSTAVGMLKEEFPHDRRWDDVEAEIFFNLTEAELTDLMVDHGNVEPLQKHEVVRAVWLTLKANPAITDNALTIKLRGLLVRYFPGGSNIKDPKELGDHYRGVIQNIRNGYRLPDVARDYFMKEIKGECKWPQKRNDVQRLVKVYEDESKLDTTGQTTKEKPGPTFLTVWAEVLEKINSQENANATRSVNMMTRNELTKFKDTAGCPTLTRFALLIMRDSVISEPDAKLLTLSDLYKQVETFIPADLLAKINAVMTPKQTVPAPTPTPAPTPSPTPVAVVPNKSAPKVAATK